MPGARASRARCHELAYVEYITEKSEWVWVSPSPGLRAELPGRGGGGGSSQITQWDLATLWVWPDANGCSSGVC